MQHKQEDGLELPSHLQEQVEMPEFPNDVRWELGLEELDDLLPQILTLHIQLTRDFLSWS